MKLSVSHPLRPRRRSLNTARVADAFGLDVDDPAGPHPGGSDPDGGAGGRLTLADGLEVPAGPGRVALFAGPSGSGKSSLLRAAAAGLAAAAVPAVDAGRLELPDLPLADALAGRLPGGFAAASALLSRCGLAEPRLLLRTPAELSDGQRFRFRLALAVADAVADAGAGRGANADGANVGGGGGPGAVVCDEFTAPLDRTLARAVAHNVRRLCDATGVGFLLATAHADLAADLRPDLTVACRLNGPPRVFGPAAGTGEEQNERGPNPAAGRRALGPLFAAGDLGGRVSFAGDLFLTTASRGDWPRFARWHYRSHTVGVVRAGALLWHGRPPGDDEETDVRHAEPVGAALFCSAPLSLRGRNRYFGTGARWTAANLKALNAQLVTLSRVVLHPTYRGCGLAGPFVAAACDACPFPWVEALAELGNTHPFLERAGFRRVEVGPPKRAGSYKQHAALYGAGGRGKRKPQLSAASHAKSRFAAPAYFVRDNRSAPAVVAARAARRGDLDHLDPKEEDR